MPKIVIDQFQLTEEYIKILLTELKEKGIGNQDDLQRYLKDYSYMNDTTRKCHLLISPNDKKESFAFPYENE